LYISSDQRCWQGTILVTPKVSFLPLLCSD